MVTLALSQKQQRDKDNTHAAQRQCVREIELARPNHPAPGENNAGQQRDRPWKPPGQMHDQELIGGHPEEIVCLIGKSAQMTKPHRAGLIMKIPGKMPLHPDVPTTDEQSEDLMIFPSQPTAK